MADDVRSKWTGRKPVGVQVPPFPQIVDNSVRFEYRGRGGNGSRIAVYGYSEAHEGHVGSIPTVPTKRNASRKEGKKKVRIKWISELFS